MCSLQMIEQEKKNISIFSLWICHFLTVCSGFDDKTTSQRSSPQAFALTWTLSGLSNHKHVISKRADFQLEFRTQIWAMH